MFDVSRPTLRRALAGLVRDGKVEKRCGVGNFVADSTKSISRELVFVCSDFLSFPKTIQEFCAKATERHYLSSIVPLNGDRTTQNRIIATVIDRKPAGVAVLPVNGFSDLEEFGRLHDSGIPTVYLLRQPDGYEENLIENPSGDAICEIVRMLYLDGYRKFAFFGSESHAQATTDIRRDGFLDGMKKCRLKVHASGICVKGASSEERDAFFEQFRGKGRPEVVCAVSDYSAADFLEQLNARGMEKGDLVLAGFDNNHVMPCFLRHFITGVPAQEETGRAMADLLIRQVENPGFARQRIKIAPRIIDYRNRRSLEF
jgi:DNA-binding LacI/PurR family transcriptional regulator